MTTEPGPLGETKHFVGPVPAGIGEGIKWGDGETRSSERCVTISIINSPIIDSLLPHHVTKKLPQHENRFSARKPKGPRVPSQLAAA